MLNASEIMELQKLAGMENFKKLTIPQYLERERLIRLLQCLPTDIMGNHGVGALADHLIANDVVPVVRCKGCKHWKQSGSMAGNTFDDLQPIGGCEWAKCCRKANDFCSYGERREGE